MDILLLSQLFDPEPTFKGLVFARALRAAGHAVRVLTTFPNYPDGKIYPGYVQRLWHEETIDDVPILRVPIYPSHDYSSVKRVACYASFALSAATLGLVRLPRPDLLYVYHPPATVGLPALALHHLRGVPFVYDVQDLWPDTLASTGMVGSRIALGLVDQWCHRVYRAASRVVVLSPGFKRLISQRGVPEEKIEVIYNWCDEAAIRPESYDPDLAQSLSLRTGFNLMFAGTMGVAQGLDTVLRAAAVCQAQNLPATFTFVGGGVERERLLQRARELGLRNTCFVPPQPMARMGKVIGLADIMLIHLRDNPLFTVTIPSKTQAYLAAGKPILMAVRGDAANLVERAGAGILCPSDDADAMAVAVRRFMEIPVEERAAMGRAGRDFYLKHLSLDAGVARFNALFEDVIVAAPQ